jgi:hypothetical protein
MSYLGALLLLGLLILIHEAGHFAAARLAGIPVAGFAVGFGPRIWSRRRGGTEYSLRAFPLGGFVLPGVEDDAGFRAIPLGRRLAFFLGGPLANLAAAVPLFAAWNVLRHGPSFRALAVTPFVQTLATCWQMASGLPKLLASPAALSGVVGIIVEGGRQAQAGGGDRAGDLAHPLPRGLEPPADPRPRRRPDRHGLPRRGFPPPRPPARPRVRRRPAPPRGAHGLRERARRDPLLGPRLRGLPRRRSLSLSVVGAAGPSRGLELKAGTSSR